MMLGQCTIPDRPSDNGESYHYTWSDIDNNTNYKIAIRMLILMGMMVMTRT